MSDLSQYTGGSAGVNTRLWGRNGQSPHSIVHPKHPMRLCQTIQVQSLKEMKHVLDTGMTIVNTLGLSKYLSNSFLATREKTPVEHEVFNANQRILRLNNTILTTEEFLKTENALDALLGSLRLALDAIEAQLWYLIFTGGFVFIPSFFITSPDFSYREVLALGRASVHRVAGTENVHVLTPVIHYAAMLMDNTAGNTPTQQAGVTEHHLYDAPRATIIPLAHNTNFVINNVITNDETGFHDLIPFYPDYLPSLFVRYIYEEISVEKINEIAGQRNLRRVVLGRYLMFELPTVYSQNGVPAMPIVAINATFALTNTMNKFSNGFQNISAIASF
jgi:hypothetical protein